MPGGTVLRRQVVFRVKTLTAVALTVASTHPVAKLIHRRRGAQLSRIQWRRLRPRGTAVIRKSVLGIITNAKLPSSITCTLPCTVVVTGTRNAALTFLELSTKVVNTAPL